MNKYVVLLQEKAKGTLTDTLLAQHVEHLKELNRKGALFLCGPFKAGGGALQILLADTLQEAETLALRDPFIARRYYRRYEIFELMEANEGNCYLMEDTQIALNKQGK